MALTQLTRGVSVSFFISKYCHYSPAVAKYYNFVIFNFHVKQEILVFKKKRFLFFSKKFFFEKHFLFQITVLFKKNDFLNFFHNKFFLNKSFFKKKVYLNKIVVEKETF